MIFAVVVLYKTKLENSQTLISLNECIHTDLSLTQNLKIIVYDNSPDFNNDDNLKNEYIYIADQANPGISKAYNEAIKFAQKDKADWLITFDQDTRIPCTYFEDVYTTINSINENIVAIVPKIIGQNNQQISPMYVKKGFRQFPVYAGNCGVQGVTAINSGAVIRLSYLNIKGGYTSDFNLDMLDHWLFNEIRKDQKKVYIINTVINHELSVLDYSGLVKVERYKNILLSEKLFYTKYLSSEKKSYKKRLLLRSIKQKILLRNKEYSKLTYDAWRNL